MKKKKLIAIVGAVLAVVICASVILIVALNGKKGVKDAISIMTEELSGLFNPFYATTGTDQDVIGLTQIGMLSTEYDAEKEEPITVAGKDYPTVALAYKYEKNAQNDTEYYFVIKNDIKFSDGKKLTMNDVMFNIYEYLDPVYTGSSTMYSIKIKGLANYRTQTKGSTGADKTEDKQATTASNYAAMRRLELVNIYKKSAYPAGSTSYNADRAKMQELVNAWNVSGSYKTALGGTLTDEQYKQQLMADYDFTAKTFKDEIESDYKAAKESYDLTSDLYKPHAELLKNDVFKFFLYEGYIQPEYKKGSDGKDDKSTIEKFKNTDYVERFSTEEAARNFVYNDKLQYHLDQVLTYWGTAGTVLTQYTADARSMLLKQLVKDGMVVDHIEGIQSLGHNTDISEVTIDGATYKVAKEHNEDGSPKNSNEYDVLRITVEGTDPKAIYNFGFTVAPQHYYTADEQYPNGRPVDIAKYNFGLPFSDSTFQTNTIQSQLHVGVPVGAGPYAATNKNNEDNPKPEDFWNNNFVYYKANENFLLGAPKCAKLNFQVISSSNAIDKLERGEVDYISPQLKTENVERLSKLNKQGVKMLSAWQLGYGYIGINAGKVENIYIRRAIMAAMQVSLAVNYYDADAAEVISWPMSKVSWAYPYEADGKTQKQNGHDYTQWTGEAAAITKIKTLMTNAGVQPGDESLKITFTIAGSSITEHPTYNVFKHAQEILNSEELGWQVEVKADSQALTKLSTGSLEVWAAAWGSTIDPDMYQVYHKNSSATSVYAWGYREIKANSSKYAEETRIINELSDLIDQGRETDDRATRKGIYEKAMGKVLDLAVEMPVYQRKNLYAYNSKTVKGFNEVVNPYSSPLEKVWELELIG